MTTAGSSPRVLSPPPERRQHPLHPHSYPQQHWERALSLCAWTQQAALESTTFSPVRVLSQTTDCMLES